MRLERDRAGILLQIVPTISNFAANGGTTFTLTGSGFAEGSSTVVLPTFAWNDPSRYHGQDVYGANSTMTVVGPIGASRLNVQIRTSGGISAVFATGQP